jgi:nucleoside-diphosphate-sugar epimerase
VFSVFGGAGFIGSELCKNSDFIAEDRYALEAKHNKIAYLVSTTHNYHLLDGNIDIDVDTNIKHLLSVLWANKEKYGTDFEITFVSSWFVYGKTNVCPVSETDYCNPTGFYSITKRAAEQLLISFCETFGIKWKIIRLSNILGVGDRGMSKRKNALQYMIRELCWGNDIQLYDDDIYRDYLHVSDCAEAIRLICCGNNFGQIYNVGSGRPTKISDAVFYAQNLAQSGSIELCQVPEFHKTVQVKNMWLNVDKVQREFGWVATKSVGEIIEELVEYYKNNEKG